MPNPTMDDFALDDHNEEKFWSHGLTGDQVRQVVDRPYTIRPNQKGRRASYQIIGLDRQGRCLAVPIEPFHDRAVWRPVTAWLCKASERALLPKAVR